MGITLAADGLLSKWGFQDGGTPDEYLDWLDEQKYPYPDDWHKVLCRLIRTRLVPQISAFGVGIDVYEIVTSHNPIRAQFVNGVEVDDYADNGGVLPDVDVTVSFEDVYEVQKEVDTQ